MAAQKPSGAWAWRVAAGTVALLLAQAAPGPAAAETAAPAIAWDEKYYNPAPAGGDFILPMPCGGAMVFRRIDTPNTEGAIGDVPLVLGQEGDAQPFLNGLRRGYVSGPFADGGGTARGYFLMAKYELAEAQWAAVMDSACPAKPPRKRDFVPAVDHGKLDYDLFAQRYTLWLMANAPQSLPETGSTRAFLRLPTEEEWEYAARGGLALPDALFRAPVPPVPEGQALAEYIAHGGSDSAGGKLQIIGTLRPNPLGLHDMLGNAAEIVGSPFALVRHGRLHGQAGGYVKRGGDARTPAGGISSATRFEVPPYDLLSGRATTDRFTGTRLVLSALSITSPAQSGDLIAALEALARPDPGLSGTATEAEALRLLEGMAAEAPDGQSKSRIDRIRAVIDAAQAERNAQRDRTLRLVMGSAVVVCDQAVQGLLNTLVISSVIVDYDALEAEALQRGDEATAAQVRAERADGQARLQSLKNRTTGYTVEYADFVEGLASDYSGALLTRQLEFLRPDIIAKSAQRGSCLALLEGHLDGRRQAGFADIDLITRDFQALAQAKVDKQ